MRKFIETVILERNLVAFRLSKLYFYNPAISLLGKYQPLIIMCP